MLNATYRAVLAIYDRRHCYTDLDNTTNIAKPLTIQIVVQAKNIEIVALSTGVIRTTSIKTLQNDITQLAKDSGLDIQDNHFIVITHKSTTGHTVYEVSIKYDTLNVFQNHETLEDAVAAALCLAAVERDETRYYCVDHYYFADGFLVHTTQEENYFVADFDIRDALYIAYPAGSEATKEPDIAKFRRWATEIEPRVRKAAKHTTIRPIDLICDVDPISANERLHKLDTIKKNIWAAKVRIEQCAIQKRSPFLKQSAEAQREEIQCRQIIENSRDILYTIAKHASDPKLAAAATAELL